MRSEEEIRHLLMRFASADPGQSVTLHGEWESFGEIDLNIEYWEEQGPWELALEWVLNDKGEKP